MHVELRVPHGTAVESPFAGVVHQPAAGVLQLDGPQLSVRLWGVTPSLHTGAALVKGQVLGSVSGPLIGAVVPRHCFQCAVVLHTVSRAGLASVVPIAGGVAGTGLRC